VRHRALAPSPPALAGLSAILFPALAASAQCTRVEIVWDFSAPGRTCVETGGFTFGAFLHPGCGGPPSFHDFCFHRATIAPTCLKRSDCQAGPEPCTQAGGAAASWQTFGLWGFLEAAAGTAWCLDGIWYPVGAAVAKAFVYIAWEDLVPQPATVAIKAPVGDPAFLRARSCPVGMIDVVCVATGARTRYFAQLCEFPCGSIVPPGWGRTPLGWEYPLTFTGCAGQVRVEQTLLTFRDNAFDVNGDGRFNAADAAALAAMLGLPAVGALQRWDFDGDGFIGSGDVETLQGLLDAGLDAGIFGDANGDGRLTCRDIAAAQPSWGASAGQPHYNIRLDYNLDGCLNQIDLDAFNLLAFFAEADANEDGMVDLNDFLVYLNWYVAGDRRADFNDDGVVDFDDYLVFLNAFNSPVFC
jgi:hypothetical protein